MSNPVVLGQDQAHQNYDWPRFVEAIRKAHFLPEAQIKDTFLGSDGATLLSRAAWIDGLGFGVKSVTVMAENKTIGLPTVQGNMLVFDPSNGTLRGVIDSALITNLKTAADSALGAQILARPNSQTHLIIGAGSVAGNVAAAYRVCMPALSETLIWNRTSDKAEALANDLQTDGINARSVTDLQATVAQADIISTSTMSSSPILCGEWVVPGTHVDLIGAYRADMREADNSLLKKARIFVDSYSSTIEHIGEIAIPIAEGAIAQSDILADLYELVRETSGRNDDQEITVFKNGGGAHLDLMIACELLQRT